MAKKVLLLYLLTWIVVSVVAQEKSDFNNHFQWADSVYKSMNKKERLAQLFVVTIDSKSLKNKENILQSLSHKKGIGGLFFSNTNPWEQVQFISSYQNKFRTPLLVGMNASNGLHNDIVAAYQYPNAYTLSKIKNVDLLKRMESHITEQLSIVGATVDLSVANANTNINKEQLNSLGIDHVYSNSRNKFYMFSANKIETSKKSIKKAIRKKIINGDSIEVNIKNILQRKYRLAHNSKKVNPDNLLLKLKRPKYNVLIEQLYQSAIHIKQDDILPIRIIDTTTFASITIGGTAEIANEYFSRYAFFTHYNSDLALSKMNEVLSSYKVVVVNIMSDDKLSNEHLKILKQLEKATNLVVCFYSRTPEYGSNFKTIVEANENNAYTQRLVPQFIFGAISNNGDTLNRLAYSYPETVGIDSKALINVDKIAIEAVATGATPGCQIIIAKDGKVIFDKNYGYYTYDSLQPVTSSTIYDLASITKVAATLQVVLFMQEKGLINLDYKISRYLPELKGTNKENMIIRDILSHQAGLWPYLPFWKNTMENAIHLPGFYSYHPQDAYPFYVAKGLYSHVQIEEKVWQWVIESDLREKKDHISYDYKYSDMGYYMLYRMAEKILNQPIEDFLTQNIYDPLGASTLNYLPLCKFSSDLIAPTENDISFRRSQIIGTVHDQGAAMIGGVAGHAGLFSNANDLAKLFQMHLQNGEYGGIKYFEKSTLEEFQQPQYASTRRGAGWDKPIPGTWYGPTGEFASARTFGHTGFTGTAVWADPAYNLVYVFLSNRVYPDANNGKLYRNNIRTRIQDEIYKAIWSYSSQND